MTRGRSFADNANDDSARVAEDRDRRAAILPMLAGQLVDCFLEGFALYAVAANPGWPWDPATAAEPLVRDTKGTRPMRRVVRRSNL